MKENKNKALTYEELTARCRKQEEYIKELEDKIYGTLCDNEKLTEVAKPDYDELCRQISNLSHQLSMLVEENNALRWSLTTAHKEITSWKSCSDGWEENYYREHKRAEKLYDEWSELKKKNNDK